MSPALEALAAFVYEHQYDAGGPRLRTSLLTAILADRYGLDPAKAVRVADGVEDDDNVDAAGDLRDHLIEQARRAGLAAQMGEEVPA
ncbi:hypothetical protein ACFYUV_20870 [Nonomuraea sp. NPDC003560]|uniref:hypothetical protein n=1 Tax=Nonomuraea sp. NPDC003560 TaxID=3364341 RepID=UPI003673CA38